MEAQFVCLRQLRATESHQDLEHHCVCRQSIQGQETTSALVAHLSPTSSTAEGLTNTTMPTSDRDLDKTLGALGKLLILWMQVPWDSDCAATTKIHSNNGFAPNRISLAYRALAAPQDHHSWKD